jgi:hypothetical protein
MSVARPVDLRLRIEQLQLWEFFLLQGIETDMSPAELLEWMHGNSILFGEDRSAKRGAAYFGWVK